MRFLGKHRIRVVEELPVTGDPGEQVVFNNTLYTWHPIFGTWEPPLGWRTLVTSADQSENTTTNYKTIFTFDVVPNAIYEIRTILRQKNINAAVGPRFRLTSPTGTTQYFSLTRANTGSSMDTVSMGASGYEAVFSSNLANNMIFAMRGRGMLLTGDEGGPVTLSFALNAVNGAGVEQILAKSMLMYRRVI